MLSDIIESECIEFTPTFDVFNTQKGLKISNKCKTLTSTILGWKFSLSNFKMSPDGIYYCEFKINKTNSFNIIVGIVNPSFSIMGLNSSLVGNIDFNSYVWNLYNGYLYGPSKEEHKYYYNKPDLGDNIGILYNGMTGDLVFTKNKETLGIAFKNIPINKIYHVIVSLHCIDDQITANT